jgi:succinoglycan biosynthesis protein ExoU
MRGDNAEAVAVIIAAHNAQATIGRAVRSALAQERVTEVVVVDDASQDATQDAAKAQDDRSGRLKVLALTTNAGPAAARNIALDQSRAPLVCVLDSDDYLLAGRMQRLLGCGSDWDLLADDIVIVPERLADVPFSLAGPSAQHKPATLDLAKFVEGNISSYARPRGEMGFLKPLMRRAFLERHGLRYDERLRLGEDYALYVRALLAGARFRVTNAFGYIAIERGNSLSSSHAADALKEIAGFDASCLTAHPGLLRPARSALRRHRRATLDKYHYRAVLDCKRDRGLVAALVKLSSVPQALPYIAAETLRAMHVQLGARFGQSNEACAKPDIRLLIGISPDKLALAPTVLLGNSVVCSETFVDGGENRSGQGSGNRGR